MNIFIFFSRYWEIQTPDNNNSSPELYPALDHRGSLLHQPIGSMSWNTPPSTCPSFPPYPYHQNRCPTGIRFHDVTCQPIAINGEVPVYPATTLLSHLDSDASAHHNQFVMPEEESENNQLIVQYNI